MWKPPERIKYETTVAQWPTAEAAKRSQLYSPLCAPNLDLAQRTWVPAMVPWRASDNGDVTQDVIDWYARFAAGKPGAIVVEATGIRDIPSGPLLRISDDRYVAGLRRLTNAVHEASDGETRLLIQLIDFLAIRRRPQPDAFFNRFLEITAAHRRQLGMEREKEQAIRAHLLTLTDAELEHVLSPRELDALRQGYRERVTDMHLPAIAELPVTLPALFSQAATRAQAAGFDGIELPWRQYVLQLCISQGEKVRPYRLLALSFHIKLPPMGRRYLQETVEKNIRLGASADCQEINQLDQQSGLTSAGLTNRVDQSSQTRDVPIVGDA